ncbi:MAG: transposase domain-containing protein, partial [Bacteroidales bacterium]|nr:transposase domain-containing protein [Bacteroidales bacterium]
VGNFISWRILGEEHYDVTYNLYANNLKIASNLTTSNYVHSTGTVATSYQVSPVVRGVEGEKCTASTRWSGNDQAAERTAIIYSLLGSCRLANVNPNAWLTDVLNRMPDHSIQKLSELLPTNWKPKENI